MRSGEVVLDVISGSIPQRIRRYEWSSIARECLLVSRKKGQSDNEHAILYRMLFESFALLPIYLVIKLQLVRWRMVRQMAIDGRKDCQDLKEHNEPLRLHGHTQNLFDNRNFRCTG
jgi:hypothetical protein